MKVKYLLTALALPAMFVACSQEDIATEAQMPQSSELLGKVAGDVVFNLGAESRLAWGATGDQAWEAGDEFSLFWVSDNETRKATSIDGLVGTANALYKTSDGKKFDSENIVYVGKHLLVYPAQKSHYKANTIEVIADSVQKAEVALGKRSVYTSDSLITILPPLIGDAKPEYGVVYAAGYNETVKATVKPLTSNFVLNLTFDMPESINEVTVKKVNLVADKEIFSTKGYLNATEDAVKYSPLEKAENTAAKVSLELPANTKVTKTNNSYTAQIALLPIIENDATKYSIEVVTNYGVVTIDSAKYVKNAKGQYLIANTSKQDGTFKFNELKADERVLNLAQEFDLTSNLEEKITYRGNENTVDPSYGKRITANVTVNLSEASITGMEVTNSQELIDAYTTYTLLGKKGAENFVLSSKTPFELTPEAVAAILANEKVTLEQKLTGGLKADTIKLIGAHTSIPQFNGIGTKGDVNLLSFTTGEGEEANTTVEEPVLILGAEGTWNLDVDVAPAANTWKEIINAGTLTLKETNPQKDGKEDTSKNLKTALTNMGKVEFSGNVSIPVEYTQKTGGQTIVAEGVTVNLTEATDFQKGSIDVDGKLITYANTTQIQKGVTASVSGALLANNTAILNNAGTITLDDAGRTIITNNKIESDNGSIVCASRTSSVNVSGSEQGYIKWTCNVDKYKRDARDAFNYLILTSNVTMDGDVKNITNIEVDGAAVEVVNTNKDNVALDNVFVNTGKTMIVPTGSIITTTNVSLKGDIEVYGTFEFNNRSGNGKIYDYSTKNNVIE